MASEEFLADLPAFVVDHGHIFGTFGSGGVAFALTTALISGTREPKGGGSSIGDGGGKKTRLRKRMTSDQALWTGIAAGTLYMTAGSFWSVSGDVSDALTNVFTGGEFGNVQVGAVAMGFAVVTYFREPSPGKAGVIGILASGVWTEAGGIWGLPRALILAGAQAIGLI